MSRLKIAPPKPEDVEEPQAPQIVQEAPQTVMSVRRLPKAPPARSTAPTNLHIPSEGFVDLNFKVEPELRQRFKMEAVRRGMSNKDLLAACFQVYLETYPSSEGIIQLKEPTAEQRSRRVQLRKERQARMARIRRIGSKVE